MNRLALPSATGPFAAKLASPQKSFDLGTSPEPATLGAVGLPHATFAPVHYEAGYAYPLLVWLHDNGGNERQLRQVMPLVSMRNYVAIAPRGCCSYRRRPGRFGWRQSEDAIEAAEARIFRCIDLAQQRFHIHPDRVFLIGHGSGGTMALRVAWNHPGRFAGVATIGGPLPTKACPLRRVNEVRRVPCLLSTCRQSRVYPESRVCRDLRLLHTAGCTVALRQYFCRDELTTHMLRDLDHWLMELVCG